MPNMTVPKSEVVSVNKPVALTHMSNSWTLRQMRLGNLVVKKFFKNGAVPKEFCFPKSVLEKYVGLGSTRNLDWRNKFLDEFSQDLKFNEFGKDNRVIPVSAPLLSRKAFVGGDFYFKVNPEVVPVLIQAADLYARIPLEIQMDLTTAPALAMYEYFVGELATSDGHQKIEVTLDLDVFKKRVGVKKGEYKEYWRLNDKVIKPLVENINTVSDIRILEAIPTKKGRKVVSIYFEVEEKKRFLYKETEYLENEEDLEANKRLEEFLKERGVSGQKSKALVELYDAERIGRNVEYAQEQANSGAIKSLAGYIVKAIEEDYCKETVEVKKQDEIIDVEYELVDGDHQSDEDLREQFAEYKVNVIDMYLSEQDDQWLAETKDKLKQAYVQDARFLKGLKSKGWDAVYVKSALRNYVRDLALKDAHQKDFEAYKAWCSEIKDAA